RIGSDSEVIHYCDTRRGLVVRSPAEERWAEGERPSFVLRKARLLRDRGGSVRCGGGGGFLMAMPVMLFDLGGGLRRLRGRVARGRPKSSGRRRQSGGQHKQGNSIFHLFISSCFDFI